MPRISKIDPFMTQYELGGVNFPLKSKNWKNIQRNYTKIDFNCLFAEKSKKEIKQA